MKSKSTEETLALGVDQRWKAPPQSASDIKNMRVEDVGLGWINDRGWEPLLVPPDGGIEGFPTSELAEKQSPIRFLDVWARHGNSEVYYLYERFGKLQYDYGNPGTSTTPKVILSSDRNLPKADDPGTQIQPFGRFALICNGYDRPIMFWGRDKTTPFSWTQKPNPPGVYDVDPTILRQPQNSDQRMGGYPTVWRSIGLGQDANTKWSHYRWKVSFISETGSESPLSSERGHTWYIGHVDEEGKWGIQLCNIPEGPDGTVARRIYRTKNLELNDAEQYYHVQTLEDNCTQDWIDIVPDSLLLEQAPAESDSIIIPQTFKYAASWNGVMWVGGGEDDSQFIRFSNRFLPEQFARYRFFDCSSRQGGPVTALVPYYNNLIVFRAKSIEVISAISDDTYTIGVLTNDIGTTATNTIVEVPGKGLFFLTDDGVFAITGGQSGAGLVEGNVMNISRNLHKEWRRLSEGSLARATATYSGREKEYWVHYPVDGDTENSSGAIYHSAIDQWSLRNLNKTLSSEEYHMWFTQLATDPEGWIIIGCYPDYGFTHNHATFKGYPGYELQVWSAYGSWGHHQVYASTSASKYNYTWTKMPKETNDCAYISGWHDFGDDSIKKKIMSVEVEMISQGYNDLELRYAADDAFAPLSGGSTSPMIIEKYKTTTSEPVWTIVGGTDVKNLATWGENWSNGQVCRVRWDVHTGMLGRFKFGIESGNKFHIISYQINFQTTDQKTITRRGSSG